MQVITMSREQLEQLPEMRQLATRGDTGDVRGRTLRGEFCLHTGIGMVALKGGSVLASRSAAQLVEYKAPTTPTAKTAPAAPAKREPRWKVEDLAGNDLDLTPDEIRTHVKAGKLDGSCLVRRPGGDCDELLRDVRELQEPLKAPARAAVPAPAPVAVPTPKASAILAGARRELDDEHARDMVVSGLPTERRAVKPPCAIESASVRNALAAADAARADEPPPPVKLTGSSIVAASLRAAELAAHRDEQEDHGPSAA